MRTTAQTGAASPGGAWHETVAHTAELELRVHAPTLPGLFAEAGRALAERLLGGSPATAAGAWRPIEVRAADGAALLVDWLNELLYRAEAEWWVPLEFHVGNVTDREIQARARGATVAEPPAAVKAATLHDAAICAVPGGFEAHVVLDV
jgi:SHS2 domain-containing protein